MKLSRYYHTLRYLKAEQIYFQFYYKVCAKLRQLIVRRNRYASYKAGNCIAFLPFPEKYITYRGDNVFDFLNISHSFSGKWDDRSMGDLWRYNLNYMDFILQPAMSAATGVEWIERFIASVHDNGIVDDPYPISLRGINWIKFVSMHWDKLSQTQHRNIDTFLYSQYRILSTRTERHLLANHYLENGFSLLFAAVYFQDKVFWQKAKRIVEKQLKEQILNDGAHYELSPMYHCIILERLLDCYNLLHNADDCLFEGLLGVRTLLREKASAMLAWLDAIVTKDDSIPLLNDSANGVALSPAKLREYAVRLGIEWGRSILGKSGYRHIVHSHYEAVLDMAQLGVSYNLGHAHADSSTFLLWVSGRELLVDTGTSTYNAGVRRDYERSTCAHNAVVVNKKNSSQVWGAFRCAQRAQAVIKEDGPVIFAVEHNGYSADGLRCCRRFVCNKTSFEIEDKLCGKIGYVAEAFFHLSPEVQVLRVDADRVVTDRAVFIFEGHKSITLTKKHVSYEYNILQPADCIQVSFSDTLHTIIEDFC